MSAEPLQLGFLYPGHAAEDDYPFLAERLDPPVTAEILHTSVVEDAHRVDALLDLGSDERLHACAAALKGRVAALVWACTSGSFVFGWEGAHRQAAGIELVAGAPASSAALAFVDAGRALELERVALAATYPEEVTAHFIEFLGHGGLSVVAAASQGIESAAEVGELGADAVRRLVTVNDHQDADAVLVPDTALHTAAWLRELEEAVGKPVLTANQVSMWQAARLAGHPALGHELGQLFAQSRTPLTTRARGHLS